MESNARAATSPNQSWFIGAPLTRFLALLTGISYAILESKKLHGDFNFDVNAILRQGQVYRIFTGPLTFSSSGEIIVGLLVLVNLSRRLERELGTRKFSLWLLGVGVISTIIQLLIFGQILDSLIYSGPYPSIGAVVWMFHTTAPRLHPRFFGLCGIHFSEKSMGYVFCLQIILFRGLNSVIPCSCGMVASQLFRTIPPLQKALDVPDGIASMVAATLQRFVEDPPVPLVPTTRQSRQRAPPPPVVAVMPPPEAAIEQLTSMGFDRDSVLHALQASQNNVERAADILLTGG
mmetsp:Transcript_7017/g.10640  ORF Transcript_7017/g.10640 Transcript_7017/m.10640 type:complete len:291 (+) Transcript_7017:364-1236(+)